jgi:phytoene synthase
MLNSNFLLGILMMKGEHRRAVGAIYAFCRVADDAADLDPARGKEGLALWRQELALLYSGSPRAPVMRSLHPHIGKYGLKREYFEKLLQGMEMDLARRRYETIGELEEYCDCVAGAVGLLCLQVFGLHEDPLARDYSRYLSLGLQVTNILRDAGIDAGIDRVYLPQEDFRTFSYTEKQLKEGEVNMNWFNLARFTAGRARSYFGHADRALTAGLRKSLVGPEIMRATYQVLLEKLTHALDAPVDRKVLRLSPVEKLLVAVSTWAEIRLA